ncbi:MAG: DUF697 domain-containing protein [Saprospiraceae bacterium]|nr:DUF697 domain-containing protein [Saprospiraceae bacterium]
MKENKDFESSQIIKNHVIWSMGAGLIPVPFADMLAVTGIQMDMIRQLCNLYDIDFKDTIGKAIVSSLSGSTMARIGAGAVKFIPGVGSVVGGITMSVLSGATTYALGQVFRNHFETGGTLLDFDVDRIRKKYDEWFEKGKEYAEKVKKEQVSSEPEKEPSTFVEELKILSDMKERGDITKKEYKKLKKKLISEV